MAKGGTAAKKQSKLSPSKGQQKISQFFKASSTASTEQTTVAPLVLTSPVASTAAAAVCITISDDEDNGSSEASSSRKRGKRKCAELDTSADFVATTPEAKCRQRKPRKRTQKKASKSFHPDSGFPVTSPEHMIYSYVTDVLQIQNAFKIEPKRLFPETSSLTHSAADPVMAEKKIRTEKHDNVGKESGSKTREKTIQTISAMSLTSIGIPTNLNEKIETKPPVDVAPLEPANTSKDLLDAKPGRSTDKGDAMEPVLDEGSVDAMLQDLLLDEWDLGDAFNLQTTAPALDLTSLTRCFVASSTRVGSYLQLRVRGDTNPTTAYADVLIKQPWSECEVTEGDTVSLQAERTTPADWATDLTLKSDWLIDYKVGQLVLKPDTLLSTTTVVGSLFCARKAVLAAMFPGGEPANQVMLLGTVVHEIAQKVLTDGGVASEAATLNLANELLSSRQHVMAMFAAGLDRSSVSREVNSFVPNIVAFAECKPTAGSWRGRLGQVLDAEENVWSPRLGLKGKVDLTAVITEDDQDFIAPLEIKTGRASGSAEHRGQVMLYQAMLRDMGIPSKAGLLLYLRDGVVDRVAANPSETQGLVSLRNRLMPFLSRPTTRLSADIERLTLSSDGQIASQEEVLDAFPLPNLPEPISHHSGCSRCAQLPVCALFLNASKRYTVAPDNPLLPLLSKSTAHLSPQHVTYFLRWVALLALEASEPQGTPLSLLWTRPPSRRSRCIPNLRVVGGGGDLPSNEVWLEFDRDPLKEAKPFVGSAQEGHAPIKEGDYVALSSDSRPAIYTGTLLSIEKTQVRVLLDRPMRSDHATQLLHLDALAMADPSANTRAFLRLLIEDTPRSASLRACVIDRCSPTFSKLPSSVLVAGKDIFSTLNEGQRAAVLKALSTKSFLLIKGMPGSGKTHTVSALVELLVATGNSVLLTSHTHSAVDTLLVKVMSRGIPVLRLGTEARVNPALHHATESALLGKCRTPEALGVAFAKMPVVGCTCLGANHPLLSRRVFDVCIVDESTQALQPLVLLALASARRFVLVGDPDQLAPVVRHRHARALGMDQSLFARLDGLGATAALDRQYRMNGPITALANAVTYRGQLQCANKQVEGATLRAVTTVPHEPWLAQALSAELADSVVFLDTGRMPRPDSGANEEKTITNEREAEVVAHLVTAFCAIGIPGSAQGVMATYRAQVQLLQRTLANADGPEVNTIDQFQGRDKEVVILSCSRSDPEGHSYQNQDMEVLGDNRRLTVALTRARHKLVVVGDACTLENFAPFAKLLSSLKPSNLVRLHHGVDGFSWSK